MVQAGFHAIPVDFSANKFTPKVKTLDIDLGSFAGLTLSTELIRNVKPFSAHFGLPCGTCSRAREIPVSKRLKAAGAPEPAPLRNFEHLLGVPGLKGSDLVRVESANRIYMNAVLLLFECFILQIHVILENPSRSWLWAVLAKLVKEFNNKDFSDWFFSLYDVDFDACMHGGERQKSTRFKTSSSCLQHLALACDGRREHKAWTISLGLSSWQFSTAAEAEYPALLCQRVAKAFAEIAPQHCLHHTAKLLRLQTLQLSSKQTKHHKQLISDFASFEDVLTPPNNEFCKVLERPHCRGEKQDVAEAKEDTATKNGRYRIGWFRNPVDHVGQAMALKHPCESDVAIPDILRKAVFRVLTSGMYNISKERTEFLKRLSAKAAELEQEELALRSRMNPIVNKVTSGKRLKLFEWLVEQSGFPDHMVVKHMTDGVELVGWEPESPLYDKRYSPTTCTVEQLDLDAVWRRKSILTKPMSEEEAGLANQLLEETVKEKEAGFLEGPYETEDEVSEVLGTKNWTLSPRFLLLQGEERKPRVIDNLKESGVNSAYGSSSYLNLQDSDFVSGFLSYLSGLLSNGPDISVALTDGSVLCGRLHKDFGGKPPLLGRGVDLSKAYKQIALHPSSFRFGALGVRSREGKWKFFISRSIPFGASSSVFAFNKVSRALWHVLVTQLHMFACVFFDDYPVVEFQPLEDLTSRTLHVFFDLLGWKHATSGKKAESFGPVMTVLGACFDLSSVWKGELKLYNKPGRLDRILELVRNMKQSNSATSHDLAVLQGLLNFAGGFVAGRAFKPVLHSIQNLIQSQGSGSLQRVCLSIETLAAEIQPRWLRSLGWPNNVIIYTDGAWVPSKGTAGATWGAVIIDVDSGIRHVVGGTVPSALVEQWKMLVGEQIICQIELYAVLVVRWHYSQLITQRPCIFFIDNEAARGAVIKGASPSVTMFKMVHYMSLVDAKFPSGLWFERVASKSNIADLPSRGAAQEAAELIGGQVVKSFHLPDNVISSLVSLDPLEFVKI